MYKCIHSIETWLYVCVSAIRLPPCVLLYTYTSTSIGSGGIRVLVALILHPAAVAVYVCVYMYIHIHTQYVSSWLQTVDMCAV